MQRLSIGYVKKVLNNEKSRQELEVAVAEGSSAMAISYPDLIGEVYEGDTVLLNVVAVQLRLGTGGYHFVVANLSRPEDADVEHSGHIMKLRYTPLQLNVASVEEENSPLRENILNTKSLDGLPVILCPLHSFIAPSAAGIKTVKPQAKVFYVMTDSAALPMAFSHLVQKLKQIGFLDVTISCGQSFGGDLECVNAYTGLLCAKVLEADAVIIASGPGHLGTGTALGFTGVEMGWLIDAVNDLGGKAIFSPRISFFDPRPRHKGISHHTVTVLTQLCHTEATVVFPKLENRQEAALKQQLQRSKISDRHKIVWQDGYDTIELLRRNGIELESMGRHFEDDPAFFLSPAAAGIWAMQNFSNG